jgi:hypothetical protein
MSKSVCEDVSFFFRAEGGLWSYEVLPEDQETIARHKIEPVVFPRALRESVLLHTIIGHEFGHAALASRREFYEIVRDLVKNSPVEDSKTLFAWCAKNTGASHKLTKLDQRELAESWAEEFFCDLFGLVTMGPAFLPAFRAVLEAATSASELSPYVSSHPPFGSRIVALSYAAQSLELFYSSSDKALGELSAQLDESFIRCAETWKNCAREVLDPTQVSKAAIRLSQAVKEFNLLAFPTPDAHLIGQLVNAINESIPPVSRYPTPVKTDLDGNHLSEDCVVIDFRHILLAGWLKWLGPVVGPANSDPNMFSRINRLCSHAIMQQEGISIWTERALARTREAR